MGYFIEDGVYIVTSLDIYRIMEYFSIITVAVFENEIGTYCCTKRDSLDRSIQWLTIFSETANHNKSIYITLCSRALVRNLSTPFCHRVIIRSWRHDSTFLSPNFLICESMNDAFLWKKNMREFETNQMKFYKTKNVFNKLSKSYTIMPVFRS